MWILDKNVRGETVEKLSMNYKRERSLSGGDARIARQTFFSELAKIELQTSLCHWLTRPHSEIQVTLDRWFA